MSEEFWRIQRWGSINELYRKIVISNIPSHEANKPLKTRTSSHMAIHSLLTKKSPHFSSIFYQ